MDCVGKECEWHVAALQELGDWAVGQRWSFRNAILVAGGKFQGSHVVGILMKPDWFQRLVSTVDCARHLAISFRCPGEKLLSCTSDHLPGLHAPTTDLFAQGLADLQNVCDRCKWTMVGMAANAKLGLREGIDDADTNRRLWTQ